MIPDAIFIEINDSDNPVLLGEDYGRKIREKWGLSSVENSARRIILSFPSERLLSINRSFLTGLLGPSLEKFGADKVKNIYRFIFGNFDLKHDVDRFFDTWRGNGKKAHSHFARILINHLNCNDKWVFDGNLNYFRKGKKHLLQISDSGVKVDCYTVPGLTQDEFETIKGLYNEMILKKTKEKLTEILGE